MSTTCGCWLPLLQDILTTLTTSRLQMPDMEDGRQYCLKWNNHPTNISSVFDRLRMEELFVDVTLATSDRQVRQLILFILFRFSRIFCFVFSKYKYLRYVKPQCVYA